MLKNVEARIWRRSLPVIHLATATAVTVHQLEERGFFGLDLLDLISMPHVVQYIVELGDRYHRASSRGMSARSGAVFSPSSASSAAR